MLFSGKEGQQHDIKSSDPYAALTIMERHDLAAPGHLSTRSSPGCGWRQSTSAFSSKHRWMLRPSDITAPAVPHHQRSSPPYGTPLAATIAMNLFPTLPPAEQAGWTSRAARSLLPWSLLQACPCSGRRQMSRTCCQCPPAVLCSPLAAQMEALHATVISRSCRGRAKGSCMALRPLQAADAQPPMMLVAPKASCCAGTGLAGKQS